MSDLIQKMKEANEFQHKLWGEIRKFLIDNNREPDIAILSFTDYHKLLDYFNFTQNHHVFNSSSKKVRFHEVEVFQSPNVEDGEIIIATNFKKQ